MKKTKVVAALCVAAFLNGCISWHPTPRDGNNACAKIDTSTGKCIQKLQLDGG